MLEWGMILAIVVLALCVAHLARKLDRVYRKMRSFNARFEALEKAAGLEQTKTDIGVSNL
jgi:hypothetical protein